MELTKYFLWYFFISKINAGQIVFIMLSRILHNFSRLYLRSISENIPAAVTLFPAP